MGKTARWKAAAGAALVVLSAGCEIDTSSTLTPTPVTARFNESFTGALAVSGSRFYSFNVAREGVVLLTLLSVQQNGVAIGDQLIMGVGVPAGEGCRLSNSTTTAAGFAAQFSIGLNPGVYCAQVADAGTLSAPVTFAVNISRPQ